MRLLTCIFLLFIVNDTYSREKKDVLIESANRTSTINNQKISKGVFYSLIGLIEHLGKGQLSIKDVYNGENRIVMLSGTKVKATKQLVGEKVKIEYVEVEEIIEVPVKKRRKRIKNRKHSKKFIKKKVKKMKKIETPIGGSVEHRNRAFFMTDGEVLITTNRAMDNKNNVPVYKWHLGDWRVIPKKSIVLLSKVSDMSEQSMIVLVGEVTLEGANSEPMTLKRGDWVGQGGRFGKEIQRKSFSESYTNSLLNRF